MAHNYASTSNNKKTIQTKPIPGRKDMVKNDAGGYVFQQKSFDMLRRFLVLGSECGTYYVSKDVLTERNVDNVMACVQKDPKRTLEIVKEISVNGKAAKNDPAIFVLSLLFTHGGKEIKKDLVKSFPDVCRIGTHLFTFVHYMDEMRSWGRSVREAVANWYSMDPEKLQYQVMKYKGRTVEGTKNQWTHRDVLRQAHVKPVSDMHNAIFGYVAKDRESESLKFINAVNQLYKVDSVKAAIQLIKDHKIPHDAWPTELKNEEAVWLAALNDLPMTALMRNINKMSALGIFDAGQFGNLDIVLEKFSNDEYIKRSRIHPFNVLVASMVYGQGRGERGNLSWPVNKKIVDVMMNQMFYKAFENVEPTGKRLCQALDVSSSMTSNIISSGVVTCNVASAAMAMVTARVEKHYEFIGFTGEGIKPLKITKDMPLEDVVKYMKGFTFGSTDCAKPMLWASEKGIEFDAFLIYTDNETYAGSIHPTQALKQYRNKFVKDARLIAIAMSSQGRTIVDPTDPLQLDIVGFSTDTPNLIGGFVRGEF